MPSTMNELKLVVHFVGYSTLVQLFILIKHEIVS